MSAPRSRVMAVLTVLAALGVGVAIGIAVERTVLHRSGEPWRGGRWRGGNGGRGAEPFSMMTEPPDTASRHRMRGRIVKRITDDLALSASQSTAIDAIFVRRELQLDSLRARVGPQLDTLRDHMRASMDSVLTPTQRAKWAETRRRIDARHSRSADRARRERDDSGPDSSRR